MAKQYMKRVSFNRRSRSEVLHIECPGCIVNIRVGLDHAQPEKVREVTSVEVIRDSSCCADEGPDLEWKFLGHKALTLPATGAINVRVGLVKKRK